MMRRLTTSRGEGWVKLRLFGVPLPLRDGVREINVTPLEAQALAEELLIHSYNVQGLAAPSVHIRLREAELRCKKLDRKLQARSVKLGRARAERRELYDALVDADERLQRILETTP